MVQKMHRLTDYIKMGNDRVSAEKKNAIFYIVTIAFIASLPFLYGADIAQGNESWGSNGFWHLPTILTKLGLAGATAYNFYGILITIATAWISYYCFSKIFESSEIGIVSSALYTLSSLRIYKLIVLGAVDEGSAMTFLPLVILGLYRIFTEDSNETKFKTVWVPLMIGYAGLIQTHVRTFEITVFITILFCLFYLHRFMCKNVWLEIIKSVFATVLISIPYLKPLLNHYIYLYKNMEYGSVEFIQQKGLLFVQLLFHFWKPGEEQNIQPIGIGLVLMTVLGLFLIMWFSGAFQDLKDHNMFFIKISAGIGVLLIIMSTNIFPWDRIQTLHPILIAVISNLQSPEYFVGWAMVCLIIVNAFLLRYFEKNNKNIYRTLIAAAFLNITTSSMYFLDFVKENLEEIVC